MEKTILRLYLQREGLFAPTDLEKTMAQKKDLLTMVLWSPVHDGCPIVMECPLDCLVSSEEYLCTQNKYYSLYPLVKEDIPLIKKYSSTLSRRTNGARCTNNRRRSGRSRSSRLSPRRAVRRIVVILRNRGPRRSHWTRHD